MTLQPISVFHTRYEMLEQIGRGTSATCYKIRRGDCYFALKVIGSAGLQQIELLARLDHQHVIKHVESFADDKQVYIVTEYAPGGDLAQAVELRRCTGCPYAEAELWQYCEQMVGAVQYLHGLGVIHRDIKPSNIFVSQCSLKLGDLGVSKMAESCDGSKVGTPYYLSPEMVQGKPYTCKTDIWSLGCTMYYLAMFQVPFHTDNIVALAEMITFGQLLPIDGYSAEFQQLVCSMLAKTQTQRPSAAELLKICRARHQSQGLSASFAIRKTHSRKISQSASAPKLVQAQQQQPPHLGQSKLTMRPLEINLECEATIVLRALQSNRRSQKHEAANPKLRRITELSKENLSSLSKGNSCEPMTPHKRASGHHQSAEGSKYFAVKLGGHHHHSLQKNTSRSLVRPSTGIVLKHRHVKLTQTAKPIRRAKRPKFWASVLEEEHLTPQLVVLGQYFA